MINNLMSSLFGTGRQTIRKVDSADTSTIKMDSESEFTPARDEVMVLARHFGGLASGSVQEIELHELLELCPRKRRKADAYLGLRRKLREEYGVELVIISKQRRDKDGKRNNN